MKAIIDIKTPAGQSLEGFPKTLEANNDYSVNLHISDDKSVSLDSAYLGECNVCKLNKGDKITIEIV